MTNKSVFMYRNKPSNGATCLRRTLGASFIKLKNSSFVGNATRTIINWGSGTGFPFPLNGAKVLNQPEAVAVASHKRRFFQLCDEIGRINIPRYTVNQSEAEEWINTGSVVFLRTVLQGSSGVGIVELNNVTDLKEKSKGVANPLYVEYIKKKHEFRIHFMNKRIISVQQKKKRKDVDLESINWRVRSWDNGFIFARNDIKVPQPVKDQALLVADLCGLDFGAIDIIWNERRKEAFVLEVNTAPGLCGTTVYDYAYSFAKELGLEIKFESVYDVLDQMQGNGVNVDRDSGQILEEGEQPYQPTIPTQGNRASVIRYDQL